MTIRTLMTVMTSSVIRRQTSTEKAMTGIQLSANQILYL